MNSGKIQKRLKDVPPFPFDEVNGKRATSVRMLATCLDIIVTRLHERSVLTEDEFVGILSAVHEVMKRGR